MSKPRILVDARMAGPVGHGIGLYVRQLAEGLSRLALPYEMFYLLPPDAPRDSPLRALPHEECSIPFLHPAEPFTLARKVKRLKPMLYHTPSFASLLAYPCPHVQTVHDLNHLHFGSVAHKLYYRFALLRSLKAARQVIGVSQSASLEVADWMRRNGVEKTVALAPNSVELTAPFDATVPRRFGLEPGNYFFALSNPKPHKNLPFLERAFGLARAKRSLPPLALSIGGEAAPGTVRTGLLRDSEVGSLLHHAKAFYFPSLYEGFGRPPLEAVLAGTQPIVSSLSVHREVLAGVKEAVCLDPASVHAWEESFLRQANEDGRVSAASQTWVAETWSVARLANAMDSIYRECL
jgi:glycosyltransferase involved in cell wall biosynthesis